MAYEISNYAVKITLEAGADLSAAQYKFVKISTGKAVLCAADTDIPVGVLQNSPVSGGEASILVVGGTKVVASASLSAGAIIGTNGSGKAEVRTAGTTTTKYTVGQVVLGAGNDGEILTAVINCASPARAA
jgi:hypothetical protein